MGTWSYLMSGLLPGCRAKGMAVTGPQDWQSLAGLGSWDPSRKIYMIDPMSMDFTSLGQAGSGPTF